MANNNTTHMVHTTARLPIFFFDKPRGFAFGALRRFLQAALPKGSYSLHCVQEPAEALAIAASAPAVAWMSPLSAAGRGKFKESLSAEEAKPHVRAQATWKALGAPAHFAPRYKLSDKSPGCVGTYWRSSTTGAWVCGVFHPYATEFSGRGLVARWLRGALELGRGNATPRQFRLEHNPPLERLFADGPCAPDIETRGFSDDITYFGIGDEHGGASWNWTGEVRDAVKRWMLTSRPKIGQNAIGYDFPALQRVCGVKVRGPLGDTMALRSVHCRQWPYNLQIEAAQYFMVEPWKAVYNAGGAFEWKYNAQDSEATFWLAEHLHAKLKIPYEAGLSSIDLL